MCEMVALISLLVVQSTTSADQQEEDEKAIFLQNAPRKWDEYRALAKNLQGTKIGHYVISFPREMATDVRSFTEIRQNKTSALLINKSSGFTTNRDKNKPFDKEEVFGGNAKYYFKLTRSRPDKEYLLADLNMNPTAKIVPENLAIDQFVAKRLLTHFYVLDDHLSDLIKNQTFVIKTVRRINRNHETLYRIDFDYTKVLKKRSLLRPGWMTLDADKFWCIRELHIKHLDGMFHGTYEVEQGSQKIPIMKRTITTFKGGRVDESVFEVDLHEDPNVPEHEFTLSAFGLPEPKGITWPKPIPYYLWFIGVGFASLLLGVFLRRWLTKKTPTSTPVKLGQEKSSS